MNDTIQNKLNRLLGVLGVIPNVCPLDSDTETMVWHATQAALKQAQAFEKIKEALKGVDSV